MTPVSIAAACLTALAGGVLLGRCLRGSREGNILAHAIAVVAGLIVLQSSQWTDLGRILQPKVASDWLPWICIAFSVCAMLRSWKHRLFCGIALASLTPVRLLWGSIYLPAETWSSSFAVSLVTWSAALAVSVLSNNAALDSRVSVRTLLWGVAVAATAMLITLSGSLTYGAATGVCGLAIPGVLLSTSRIPSTAATPIVCLIGLATTYAELPILASGLLLLVWIGVVLADQMPSHRAAVVIRTTAVALLLLTGSITYNRLTGQSDRSDVTETAGSSSVLEIPEEAPQRSNTASPTSASPEPSDVAEATAASLPDNADSADPFGGLPQE